MFTGRNRTPRVVEKIAEQRRVTTRPRRIISTKMFSSSEFVSAYYYVESHATILNQIGDEKAFYQEFSLGSLC